MPFISNTDAERRRMLAEIGMKAEELFADIPAAVRDPAMDVPAGLSEQEVRGRIGELAARNASNLLSFLGGGYYDHFSPAAVDAVLSRSEFYTAYTPYQPEISQGTLQAIYEYQSAVCRLTEMEAANASMYDGGTALYEAGMMAARITGRHRLLVDDSVSPIYRAMLRTHLEHHEVELVETASREGLPDRKRIAEALTDETAAVMLQNPNFFGRLDDFSGLARTAHERGATLVVSCYPVSLGLAKTPGAMGADIACGEGQSLGLPLSFGGPYLGFMATRMAHMRKMPGRLVGRTVDAEGRQGFVLTIQAREQHIRREKAVSNICSNESLCALGALVYLSLLGKEGLREVARLCADKAAYARERLGRIRGVQEGFPGQPVFNEFVIRLPADAEKVAGALLKKGIAAGIPLGRWYPDLKNALLVAVTEKRTREEIDRLATAMEDVL